MIMTSLEDIANLGRRHLHKCEQWAKNGIEEAKTSVFLQQAASNPKLVLYGAAVFCLSSWLLMRAAQFLKKSPQTRPSTPQLEKARTSFKAPTREPGGLSARFANLYKY